MLLVSVGTGLAPVPRSTRQRGGATAREIAEAVEITKVGAKELGKLNSTKHVDQLYRHCQIAGRTVDVNQHFANFTV